MRKDSPYKSLERYYPFKSFKAAAENVLAVLHNRLPFDLWMVTQTDGKNWIVLAADDHGYNVREGDVFEWTDSFCYRMTRGLGPNIAPDAAQVEAYASAPIGLEIPIGAYVGVPLVRDDGGLFGTLCAIHPTPFPELILEEDKFISSQARLLSTLLSASVREAMGDESIVTDSRLSIIDELTGLYNRRSLERFLEVEEQRCQRHGYQASIIIIDLLDLEKVNSEKGFVAGDALLKKTAETLSGAVRPFDVICRTGVVRFAVLVTDNTALQTEDLVKRIHERLQQAQIHVAIGRATRTDNTTLSAVMAEAAKNVELDSNS